MPPKKKTSKKSIKPASLVDDPSSSQSIEAVFPIQRAPIPKRPIFKAIRCRSSDMDRVRLMKVKLWRAYSFHIHQENRKYNYSRDSKEDIYDLLTSKTSQKCLKSIKSLSLDFAKNLVTFKRFLSQKFKLNKLHLPIPFVRPALKILKTSTNPGLKSLSMENSKSTLSFYDPWKEIAKIDKDHLRCISSFKSLEQISFNPEICLNELSLLSPILKLGKLKSLKNGKESPFPLVERTSFRKKLQNLSFATFNWLPDHPVFSGLINLKNILTLHLFVFLKPRTYGSVEPTQIVDFTLFSRLLNLESLSLNIGEDIILIINDLTFLKNLKNFSLQKKYLPSFKNFELQLLPKLESLQIMSPAPFDPLFYKNLLSKVPNLRSLNLTITLQNLNSLFEKSSYDFSLEKLSLDIKDIEKTLPETISAFLKDQQNLKSLTLTFAKSCSSFLEPIMRSIQSLTSLENFKLDTGCRIELIDNQIPLLNETLAKLENLRFLDFQSPQHIIGTIEILPFIDILNKHQKFTALVLDIKFLKEKMPRECLEKFKELVKNSIKFKIFNLLVRGFTRPKEIELEKILGYDISYWEDSQKTIFPPPPERFSLDKYNVTARS